MRNISKFLLFLFIDLFLLDMIFVKLLYIIIFEVPIALLTVLVFYINIIIEFIEIYLLIPGVIDIANLIIVEFYNLGLIPEQITLQIISVLSLLFLCIRIKKIINIYDRLLA